MKKLLALVLGLLVFAPFAAKAATTYTAECTPERIPIGTSQTCKIYMTTDKKLKKYSATITTRPNTTLLSVTPGNGWTGSTAGGIINLTSATEQTGKIHIFTYVLRIDQGWKEGDPCGPIIKNVTSNEEPEPDPDVPEPEVCDPETDPNGCCDPATDPNGCEEPNPNTGSTLPYIIIGGCAVLAIAGYLVARNRSKFYKI